MLRLEEEQAQQRRNQRMRQIRALVLVVLAVFGVALLISVLGGGDDDTAVQTEAPEPEAPDDQPGTGPPDPAEYSDPDLAAEVLSREPPDPEPPAEDTPAEAVEVETLIEGDGRELEPGDFVVVHYYGVLPDGTSFDDSWSRGDPFPVTIPGGVIDGWNEGLIGVQPGERRRLVIGSEKAYGAAGRPGIPPDSPLAFEIDVIDVVPGEG